MAPGRIPSYDFLVNESLSPLLRYRGCLLGGAVGDALGAPVEFMDLAQIHRRFGPGGIRDFAHAYGRIGAITDETQMTLFTAEGVLRAATRHADRGHCHAPTVIHRAYMRWLRPRVQFTAA
jgi:ADP-ribosylglycohydrolase